MIDVCEGGDGATTPATCSALTSTASVRCCNLDGGGCESNVPGCTDAATYEEAVTICAANGRRLCTPNEAIMCCGTGCGHDNRMVWTCEQCAPLPPLPPGPPVLPPAPPSPPILPFSCDYDDHCTSAGGDCCAPLSIGEAATCSAGFVPVRTGGACFGFGEGAYRCCSSAAPPPPPVPAPPPARPPRSPGTVVDEINRRYREGRPGVLVHMKDNLEDSGGGMGWRPCRTGWCAGVDHMSCSIINADTRSVFGGGGGGVVLSPATPIACGYTADGGTQGKPGGCAPERCWPGHWWGCSWAPDQMQQMLDAQGGHGYNEVVVSSRDWEAGLPDVVEAIIGDRGMHEAFLRYYGRTSADTPLVWYTGSGFVD